MAMNIDRSLEDIMKDNKKRRGSQPRRARRTATATKAIIAPPVGGVKKSIRGAKPTGKASVPTGPAAGSGPSKALVSNLPADVTEQQIKEYFTTSVGPVKKAMLTYGPNGVSRGIATIIFSQPDGANKCLTTQNGILVDGRPIKVEVILDATKAPAPAAPKGLNERVVKPKPTPKATPKPATGKKDADGAGGKGNKAKRGRNAGRSARPKKTAEQLDTEMEDYFNVDGSIANPSGAGQPVASTGADGMQEDEIM